MDGDFVREFYLCRYVEWRTHEPESGVYDFTGDADVVSYIRQAQKADLLVILRLGPYIDAEREMVCTEPQFFSIHTILKTPLSFLAI